MIGLLFLFVLGNVAAENGTDVDNVSLSLEFNLSSSDKVFLDDQEVEEGEFSSADFPYIVSEGEEQMAGIAARSFKTAERTLETENRLLMNRKKERTSFIVPFTYEDHFKLEQKEDLILSGRFLNQISPSFSFFLPEEAKVKTALDPNITLESDLELGPGSHRLEIEKTGEEEVKISEKQ